MKPLVGLNMALSRSRPVVRCRIRLLSLLTLALAVAVGPPLLAATFTVNSTADDVDAVPGNGTCATSGAVCTLRAAVREANALAGADTINLPAGTYTLTIAGSDDTAAAGDLDLTGVVSIVGGGSGSTIIQAGTTASNGIDRVFDVRASATADIAGVTVRHGQSGGSSGGGIRNAGVLTLTDAVVTANTTSSNGGGIYMEQTGATLTLTDTTITGNEGSKGAGVYIKNSDPSTFTGVDILSNTGGSDGGGLFIESASVIYVGGSIVNHVVSGKGAGVYLKGATATLTSLRIGSNTNATSGGGIYNENSATTISGVTLDNNEANSGGGMFIKDGNVEITNTTVSANSASSSGGGVRVDKDTTTLTNVTFAGNSGDNLRRQGGTIQARNVIVANPGTGVDCSGTIVNLGGSLDTDGTCGFAITANPLLGPLADNGGPTFTHAAGTGSPAIDAGIASGAPPTDQRGVARPLGAGFDIGAFEAATYSISGTVFEDANFAGTASDYDGGAADLGLSNVDIELYGAGDVYVASVTTAAGGTFTFGGVTDGTYRVRARSATIGDADTPPRGTLNGTVPGTWPYPLAEMTWGNGAARYGGQSATVDDTATGDNAGPGDTYVSVTVSGVNVTGVNQGFAYNLIVNTADDANTDNSRSKQGSLRQFIKNANGIGSTGATTANTSQFRVPTADPGYAAGTGVFTITPAAILPSIADASTVIDGATQTANIGNTNATMLGASGTVGVDQLTLGQVAGPEVSIRDGAGLATGLRIAANNATLRGLAIRGFGAADGEGAIRIDSGFTGALIENNVLGSTAESFVDPGAAERGLCGVHSEGGDAGTIRNNLIGFHDVRGIFLNAGATGWTVQGNEIRDSGLATDDGDGIAINGSATNAVTGNLIVGSSSQGYVVNSGSSGNTFTNNTVTGNGVGTPTALSQSAAITMRTTAPGTLLDRNVVELNYGAGIQVNDGASTTRLTRNAFSGNGTISARNAAGPTGQIGIDLNASGDDANLGTSPFRTLNDSGDADAGGNGLLNFPILVSAVRAGGNLSLSGFARPGSVIELFVAAADPSGFGEGQSHKITLTEGGTGAGGDDPYADTDAGSGTYGPGAINGIVQGTDMTSRFSFTLPAPAGIVVGTPLTATATLGGETSEFSGNVVASAGYFVSGTVFEDVNYGGGAGRSLAASSGVVRSGARIELFDGAGAYVTFQTADAGGNYNFAGLGASNYTVRVVNSSVSSSRPNAAGGLLAVQTFRADASGGTAAADVDRVGGEDPTKIDAGNGGTTLAALTTATTTAQSLAPVTISTSDVTGVDFGFNFDTIVSTRDAGQGSLRQFLINSNTLGNAGLAQVGQTAGVEASLFMIPNGAAHPGLRAGLTDQLTGGVAVISLTSALPTIVGAGTALDGTTQAARVGDTNPLLLGQAGTVGTALLALVQVPGPEVEIMDGVANLPLGLEVSADGTTVRGVAIWGFGNTLFNSGHSTLKVNSGTEVLIERNVIGAPATDFSDPGAARSVGQNVWVYGGTGTFHENLIGFAAGSGIDLNTGSGTWTVTGNQLVGNGLACSYCEGLATQTTGHTIRGNRIAANLGSGVDFYNSTATLLVENNTVTGNGIADPSNETAGIRVGSGSGATIERNIVSANYGPGVLVAEGMTGATISRNSIFANGTIPTEALGPASGQIGIDLLSPSDNQARGTPPYVTPNDGGDGDGGANDLLNFPVPTWAVVANGTLSIGYDLDVSAGSYRIEFFTNPSGADPSGYGEGQTFAGTVDVTHPGGGTQSFSLSFPGSVGDVLSATATKCTDGPACTAFGSSSEFSAALTATTLAVVKRAFRADGTPIPNGVVLPRGTPVKFVLYVNNPGAAAGDVSLRDVLDPAFAYVTGSLRYSDATPACALLVCTAGEEAAMFTAADTGTAGSDAVDGDVVSFAGSTVDAGNQYMANLQLNVPTGRVFALIFTVRMQ